MRIQHKKTNFRDKRGTITDIFVGDPKPHCTIIFSSKGAVRGNHYHKKTTQYTFVVSGKLKMLTRKPGQKRIYQHILNPNDLMAHAPGEAHALVAMKDTFFLAFAEGLRAGKDYEKDTYRIKPGLDELI